MSGHPMRVVVSHETRRRGAWFRNIKSKGATLVLHLECGHVSARKASHGVPQRARCMDCPENGATP